MKKFGLLLFLLSVLVTGYFWLKSTPFFASSKNTQVATEITDTQTENFEINPDALEASEPEVPVHEDWKSSYASVWSASEGSRTLTLLSSQQHFIDLPGNTFLWIPMYAFITQEGKLYSEDVQLKLNIQSENHKNPHRNNILSPLKEQHTLANLKLYAYDSEGKPLSIQKDHPLRILVPKNDLQNIHLQQEGAKAAITPELRIFFRMQATQSDSYLGKSGVLFEVKEYNPLENSLIDAFHTDWDLGTIQAHSQSDADFTVEVQSTNSSTFKTHKNSDEEGQNFTRIVREKTAVASSQKFSARIQPLFHPLFHSDQLHSNVLKEFKDRNISMEKSLGLNQSFYHSYALMHTGTYFFAVGFDQAHEHIIYSEEPSLFGLSTTPHYVQEISSKVSSYKFPTESIWVGKGFLDTDIWTLYRIHSLTGESTPTKETMAYKDLKSTFTETTWTSTTHEPFYEVQIKKLHWAKPSQKPIF